MARYFCEPGDVRTALQKRALDAQGDGPLGTDIVDSAIEAASDWFARQTNGHWYDSTSTGSIATSTVRADTVVLDVPDSPHRQRGQLFSDYQDARYPVTTAGPYAQVSLPHPYVQELTKLEVRQRNGGVEDWVASADYQQGRGEDYYLQQPGQNSYGKTYLYIYAAEIGAREDFADILTLTYDYGLDEQTESWRDVRRGIAHLAAAELVDDDNVLAQIPDNGQLVGVDTQATNLLERAMKELGPYLGPPVV